MSKLEIIHEFNMGDWNMFNILKHFYVNEDETFKLHSGGESHVFIDVLSMLTDPDLVQIIKSEVHTKINNILSYGSKDKTYLLGIELGGAILAAMYAGKWGIIRKDGSIVCPAPEGSDVLIIDDVSTTGESLEMAVEACREKGYHVVGSFALVDRSQFGKGFGSYDV